MYKNKFYFGIAILVLLLISCSDKDISNTASISLMPKRLSFITNDISFGYNTNLTAEIPVTSIDCGWTLSGNPQWLNVSPSSGKASETIALTAEENTSVDEPRLCLLFAKSSDSEYNYNKNISVSQIQAEIVLTPSETSFSCGAASSSRNIQITTNIEWTAITDESWLNAICNKNSITVTWTENTGASRTGNIYLRRSGSDITISTIQVVQGEGDVTGSQEELLFDVNGEEKTLEINAEVSWTATTSDASWLNVTPNNGNSTEKHINIKALSNYQSNDRSGFVYIKIGNTIKLEIPIKQSGIKISASRNSLDFKSVVESKSIDITSNVDWMLISSPTWLNVSPTKGTIGTTTVNYTTEENMSASERNYDVGFGLLNGSTSFLKINVSQEGKIFEELPNTLEFSNKASSKKVNVTSDGYWTSSTNSEWIHLSPESNQGNGSLTISVDENKNATDRRDEVTVSVGETKQILNIIQQGCYLVIDVEDTPLSAKACSINVYISANVPWTVDNDYPSWLSPQILGGEADSTLSIDVDYNPSINERKGAVNISSEINNYSIALTQMGRELSTSTELIEFSANGGESQPIVVTADGPYTVNIKDDWITIEELENTFTIIVSENNSRDIRESVGYIELVELPDGESLVVPIKIRQRPKSDITIGDFGNENNWNLN